MHPFWNTNPFQTTNKQSKRLKLCLWPYFNAYSVVTASDWNDHHRFYHNQKLIKRCSIIPNFFDTFGTKLFYNLTEMPLSPLSSSWLFVFFFSCIYTEQIFMVQKEDFNLYCRIKCFSSKFYVWIIRSTKTNCHK